MSEKLSYKEQLEKFDKEMMALAAKNHDEFKVKVVVDAKGYHVDVIETADGHLLIEGHGNKLAAAIEDALSDLPEALEAWGYKP